MRGTYFGGHFNSAAMLGLWASGRFSVKDIIPYIVAQLIGGIVAATALYAIASGKVGFDATASGFASNGYGDHSPGGFTLQSAIYCRNGAQCFFSNSDPWRHG